MMRLAAAAAVAVGLLGVAACGGASKPPAPRAAGSGPTPPSTGSATSAARTTPKQAQDIAADRAAAEAVSLKLSDFPTGWTSSPQDNNPDYPNLDNEVAKCLGVSVEELNRKGPADVDSPDFSDADSNTVSSSVGYTPDVATARHEFSLISDPKVPGCLTPAVQKLVSYATAHPKDPSDTLPAGATFGTAKVE